MATKYECSLCHRDLKPHCADGVCQWLTCTNLACEAKRFDLGRGVLLYETGEVEQLGTAG